MKQFRIAYIFLMIALIGILVSNFSIFVNARRQLAGAILPIPNFVNKLANRSIAFVELWRELTNFQSQNQQLLQENLSLKAQLDKLKDIEKENIELKSQLNIAANISSAGTVIARVVGLAPMGFFQTIAIDAGQNNGIKVGSPVLQSGFLVGTIIDAGPKTATVRLISAHNSFIPVQLTDSRTKGLLKGGVRGLVVEDIPVDVQVVIGESVVSAGLSQNIPAGISIGQVTEIVSTKGEIFQVAKVKTPINFNQLEVVAVIK